MNAFINVFNIRIGDVFVRAFAVLSRLIVDLQKKHNYQIPVLTDSLKINIRLGLFYRFYRLLRFRLRELLYQLFYEKFAPIKHYTDLPLK